MKKILLILICTLISTILLAQLPETYDLRDVDGENYVTSVKSQQGGTCWTHGSYASMESNLLMSGNWDAQGESGEPNLAEYHLDWWNGFNQYFNQDLEEPLNNGEGLEVHMGGDYRVTTAYMSRLEGAVRDVDAPGYDSPAEHYSDDYHIYYPKRVEWYNAGENLENIDLIKEKVIENGVMAICMCYNNSFMDGLNHYQPASDNQEPNHSVSIVGWDDNHVTQAPNAGAWKVKNSWGSNWGTQGYFWIAYEDKQACKNPEMGAISFIDVDRLNYDTVYYHDYHGWRDTLTAVSEVFNAYEANADEDIVAVSFFTAENDVDYTIKIYGEFTDGELSDERISYSGNIEFSGLHTIDLPESISFFKEEKIYLFVELSNGGHPYDRTSDVPVLLGGSSRTIVTSTARENQSYYKLDNEWLDFYHYEDPSGFQNTGNFCVKAIVNHNPTLGIGDMKLFDTGSLKVGPNPFNTTTKISIDTKNTATVTIDIYSVAGQLVEHMNLGKTIEGVNHVDWQADDLKPGVYFIHLKLDNQTVDQQKVIKVD